MKMPSLSHSVGVKKNRQQISGKLISRVDRAPHVDLVLGVRVGGQVFEERLHPAVPDVRRRVRGVQPGDLGAQLADLGDQGLGLSHNTSISNAGNPHGRRAINVPNARGEPLAAPRQCRVDDFIRPCSLSTLERQVKALQPQSPLAVKHWAGAAILREPGALVQACPARSNSRAP